MDRIRDSVMAVLQKQCETDLGKRIIPVCLILFFFSFGVLAIFINSNNTNAFTLQQMGIESIVERGHIYLEGSGTPQLQPMGDTFSYKGHVYAAKQPGQFIIGSAVYFILKKCGISYEINYTLAGGLVTLFTSVAMTASIIVLLFLLAFHVTQSLRHSIIVAIFAGFGTILFPYAGVTHHDIYGTFFSFLSYFLLFYVYRMRGHTSSDIPAQLLILLAGFFAGFALFSSLLMLAPVIATGLYVLLFKRGKNIIFFSLAFLVGLLPMFVFNWFVFGHPLNFPNIAGHFSDTMPHFSPGDILNKIYFYALSPSNAILFYSPIFVLALFGFFLFPKDYLLEKSILLLSIFLLLGHISTMGTVGHAQFGPRYLLPAMPFGMIGLAGYFIKKEDHFITAGFVRLSVLLAGVISIVVCASGSMIGVMYNTINVHAFPIYFQKIRSGTLPDFQFVYAGLFFVLLSFILFLFRIFSVNSRFSHRPKI